MYGTAASVERNCEITETGDTEGILSVCKQMSM